MLAHFWNYYCKCNLLRNCILGS